MKSKLALTIGLLLGSIFLMATITKESNSDNDFIDVRAELAMREIGHRLLLVGGDFSSRVLPIGRINDGSFQIEFQNRLSFSSDSLVAIARRSLLQSDLPMSYFVQVFDCTKKKMIYGFEEKPSLTNTKACLGRTQPIGCYIIQVTFTDLHSKNSEMSRYGDFAIGIGLLLFTFVIWMKPSKSVAAITTGRIEKRIGSLSFDEATGILNNGKESIQLSTKETNVLKILSDNINQLVQRDQLQQEVWTSQGVVTARSLDMFISKLRKKLILDPSVQIVNVHGRGYKLKVD